MKERSCAHAKIKENLRKGETKQRNKKKSQTSKKTENTKTRNIKTNEQSII